MDCTSVGDVCHELVGIHVEAPAESLVGYNRPVHVGNGDCGSSIPIKNNDTINFNKHVIVKSLHGDQVEAIVGVAATRSDLSSINSGRVMSDVIDSTVGGMDPVPENPLINYPDGVGVDMKATSTQKVSENSPNPAGARVGNEPLYTPDDYTKALAV